MQMRIAAVAPLRNRDFSLFWLGQWVSQVGDNVFLVAQNWLIWQLTGSGAAMATVTLCGLVPSMAMLLVGGTLVDRWPRRWVSVGSDVARGAILLVLAGLYAAGRLEPAHLYAMSALFGLISAFARPAFRALVQALLPTDDLVSGNALISLGASVAGIAGPAVGGLIMGFGGAGAAFFVDGVSFVAAAGAMLLAHAEEPARSTSRAPLRVQALWADLVEAVRLVAGQRFLAVSIAAMSLIVITGQAPVVLLRPWIAAQAGGGAWTLSMAYSCFSAGMFAAVTVLSGLKVTRRRGVLIYATMALGGMSQVGMAFVAAPWHLWVLDFLLGATVMVHGVLWPALLQENVPKEAMGRVAAIDQFGTLVLYPAGVAAVGFLSTLHGGSFGALLGGGLLTAAVAAGALLTGPVRRQD